MLTEHQLPLHPKNVIFGCVSHKVTVTSVVALLLLRVLCHGDGMSTTPL